MSGAVLEAVQIAQAVFSVRVSPEVSSVALAALASVPGTAFAGEFQEYLTADVRPQFPVLLKDAPMAVALVDCDSNPEGALETMERLQQLLPGKIRLVAVGSQTDASFLLRAMRAGCNEFLAKPLQQEDLAAALRRFQKGQQASAGGSGELGKLLSFLGVKGGVGTTTMAVHVATHLVRKHKKRVLLVDHKHQLGHVALYLGIKDTKYYFSELLRNADRLDADLLEGFVVRHSSGLDVIASPDMCAPWHDGSAEDMERVVAYLRGRYEYVLFDSDTLYTTMLSPLIAASEEIALICTPDVASLRDMTRHIEHLSLTDGFASKLRVIVNRSSSEAAVTPEQIESAVRFPVSAEIPNNYAELVRAINAGEPIGPQARGSFTQAIGRWATRLAAMTDTVQTAAPARKRFGLW